MTDLRSRERPWGRHPAPPSRKAFETVRRLLSDIPGGEEGRQPYAEILEAADLPPSSPPRHRVIFYCGRQTLSIDGVSISLPLGREFALLSILAERRGRGEVTPRHEHEIDWKGAVDALRRRIRKAAGENLLRCVVLPASGPPGGYALAPAVRIRRD